MESLSLLPTERKFLLVAIRGFFDGRGQHGSNLRVLSALAGDGDAWSDLSTVWQQRVNAPLDGAPLSVTDCLERIKTSTNGSPPHGKYNSVVTATECTDALQAATEILSRYTSAGAGLRAYSCGVDMVAYRTAATQGAALIEPEAMCVDDLLPLIDCAFPDPLRFEYFFDQSEPYKHYVKKFWKDNPAKRARGPYYLRRVDILTSAPDTRIPIQCADVYTWIVHTYCEAAYLHNHAKHIPACLAAVLRDPPQTHWITTDHLQSVHARNRVLGSMTRVPDWAMSQWQ